MDSYAADNSKLENELRVWNRSIEDEKRRQLVLDDEIERLREMVSDRDDVIKNCGYQIIRSDSHGETKLLSEDCLSLLGLEKATSSVIGKSLFNINDYYKLHSRVLTPLP